MTFIRIAYDVIRGRKHGGLEGQVVRTSCTFLPSRGGRQVQLRALLGGSSESECVAAAAWDPDCSGVVQLGGTSADSGAPYCMCKKHGGRCSPIPPTNLYAKKWMSLSSKCGIEGTCLVFL